MSPPDSPRQVQTQEPSAVELAARELQLAFRAIDGRDTRVEPELNMTTCERLSAAQGQGAGGSGLDQPFLG